MYSEDNSLNSANYVLMQWYRRIREAQFSHYHSYNKYQKFYYRLGIPSTILSTFIGTSIFSTLKLSTTIETQILVGFISIITAIIAGLQTFFKFSQKAEEHKKAATRYGDLRREIELLFAKQKYPETEILEIIKIRINNLAYDSPPIQKDSWSHTENQIKDDISSFESKFNWENQQ
ncbi:SLATT domain-containing protein [Methylomonas sp. UP202]|uniref:SLATT domain-containing protein n=1 Tax=Methylomonas sp. UP202 TaxID=3040943 RepID=UPI00247B2558|nr:SLATT domain-containing protein [Methylomonas sp. UP202]WGS84658.1 SLATT domain-containing protein [Methylomonas sp. UP202]